MRHRRSSVAVRSLAAVLVVLATGLAGCDGGSDSDASREARLEVVVDFNVGDGRLAVDAPLDARQLAIGPDGDVYLAAGYEVRRVDPRRGTIAALQGTPLARCADGASPETTCPTGIAAVAVDRAGVVYFAVADGRILRLPPGGGEPVFVAGATADRCPDHLPITGPAADVCFAGITDLAFDPAGALVIADGSAGRVLRLDLAAGSVTVVAGDGRRDALPCADDVVATATCIGPPTGIAVDHAGGVLIASPDLPVRRVDPATGLIARVIGRYSCDFGADRGDGGDALDACVRAADVAVASDGTVYVADPGDARIRRVDAHTGVITTFDGDLGTRVATDALALDQDDRLYALGYDVDFLARRVRRFEAGPGSGVVVAGNGILGFCGDDGPAVDACLGFVLDTEVGADGDVYVADFGARRVRRIVNGRITTVAGNGGFRDVGETACRDGVRATETCVDSPARLAAGPGGELYVQEGVAFDDFNRVRRIDRDGIITTVVGGCTVEAEATTVAASDACTTIVDIATAPDGTLYLAELTRVLRLDAAANRLVPVVAAPVDCAAGDGARAECFQARGLAVDRAGNAYVTDGARVRRITPDGAIAIVAGSGETGWCGDGGLAVDACLFAGRVVPDDDGNLFVASAGVVRRVDAATGIITTVAGTSEGECAFNDGTSVPPNLGCATVHAIDDRGRLIYPEQSRYYFTRIVRLTLPAGRPVR